MEKDIIENFPAKGGNVNTNRGDECLAVAWTVTGTDSDLTGKGRVELFVCSGSKGVMTCRIDLPFGQCSCEQLNAHKVCPRGLDDLAREKISQVLREEVREGFISATVLGFHVVFLVENGGRIRKILGKF